MLALEGKALNEVRRESLLCSRTGQIIIAGFAWLLVFLAATHRSQSPVVFGLYSRRYAVLLAVFLLVACTLSVVKPTWLVKLWRVRAKIAINGALLLLMISLAEFAVRAVDAYGVSYYDAVSDYMVNMEADTHRVYRHKASSEQRYAKVVVTYNEKGLRDRPILPKAKGELRILALGDSIVFGWGVAQDQIFPVKLEALLQSRLGRSVRVINSGVGGYNTVQELAYFKEEGIILQPDLVLLTYVENDIDETPSYLMRGEHGQSIFAIASRALQKLWLYRLVQHAHDYGFTARDDYRPTRSQRSSGWQASMSAIDELVSICRVHNVPLIIYYYRLKTDSDNTLLQDVVSHAKGVSVRDVSPWFAGHDISALTISKIDPHPNAQAHELMAEHIALDVQNYLVSPK